ncbi:reverse transcriptase domain-containing protein [Tanacetum coccineum]
MVKKVDDMTIAEYIEYEERVKRQYNRKLGSYFLTYSSHCTSSNNTTIEFPCIAYFNPIQPNNEFNYDSEDMKLDEEAGSEEDLDEWFKAEMEKHMSKQNEKNKEDALIAIIKSIREECRVVHKNKQISALEGADLKKSSETMEDTINNDSFSSNFPSLEELNPRSFLLPFTINNYNSYAMANIDASNNVMPRSIYEYMKLANLGGATMSVEMDDMKQQETLGTVKNVLVKIDKFEFSCDFVITDMPKNLGEMI